MINLTSPKLEIIYEDDNMLAINKPAGLVVHPDKHHESGTLIDQIIKIRPEIGGVGDEPKTRPGIVHRLDKDTSGVLIIAKTQESFEFLKKAFQEHKIEKKYIALVVGFIKEKNGEINLPIGRSYKDPTKRVAKGKMRGKIRDALTYYKVLEQIQDYTLLEVSPQTGRTHQIRTHLKSIGHPVVCDSLYAGKLLKCPLGLKRHFLHASSLELTTIDESRLKIEAELPEDLEKTLEGLRK